MYFTGIIIAVGGKGMVSQEPEAKRLVRFY